MPRIDRFRQRLARTLHPGLRDAPGLSALNRLVVWLILLSLLLVVLETEPAVEEPYGALFLDLEMEMAVLAVFAVEYASRVWTSTENPDCASRWAWLSHSGR